MSEANAEIKAKNINNERKRVTKKGTGGSTFVVHPPHESIPSMMICWSDRRHFPKASTPSQCKGRHIF